MKMLLLLLLTTNIYSRCQPYSDKEMVKIDIQIKSMLIKMNQKGELRADSLNCDQKEFSGIDFYLAGVKEKHLLISKLKNEWVNVLDRNILKLRESFEFVRNMLTEQALMKANIKSIAHSKATTTYDLHVSLIDSLTTSDSKPLYRFINIKSVYSHEQAKFKNYLNLKSKDIHFDKMNLQISIIPLKMSTLVFYRGGKIIKKIRTASLKSSRL